MALNASLNYSLALRFASVDYDKSTAQTENEEREKVVRSECSIVVRTVLTTSVPCRMSGMHVSFRNKITNSFATPKISYYSLTCLGTGTKDI